MATFILTPEAGARGELRAHTPWRAVPPVVREDEPYHRDVKRGFTRTRARTPLNRSIVASRFEPLGRARHRRVTA